MQVQASFFLSVSNFDAIDMTHILMAMCSDETERKNKKKKKKERKVRSESKIASC